MSLVVLIHYNEIGLKGGNRRMFERQLQNNIQKVLGDLFVENLPNPQVKWQYGRLYIENFSEADWPKIKTRLQKIFGIANFVLAEKVTLQCHLLEPEGSSEPERPEGEARRISGVLTQVKSVLTEKFLSPTLALSLWRRLNAARVLDDLKKGEGKWSFRVTSKRAQKDFPLTSQQVNERLGEFIQQKTQARVDLENPDIIFYVEIVNKSAFVYVDRDPSALPQDDTAGIIQGAGGLPVGVSGKAVCLISGGIDSPVAAWLAMKRGLQVSFIHFHSAPQTDTASQDKVKRIIGTLNQWQPASRGRRKFHAVLTAVTPHNDNLLFIPFLDFQKNVLTKTPAKYRVILYRREMLRQAEKLAQQIGAKAIITGEALGQVASQTIENLAVIEQIAGLPVLRPLICFDKQEIIALAQKIGTYEISIEPHQDCCSLFVPEHPATKAKLAEILAIEKNLNLDI